MEHFNNSDSLYRYFKKTISAEAGKEIEQLQSDIKSLKEEAKQAYTEQLKSQSEQVLSKKIEALDLAYHTTLSLKQNQLHQQLMERRTALIEKLFVQLAEQIKAYQKSLDYQKELVAQVKALDLKQYTHIMVNKADASLLKNICEVTVDDTIIAGFKTSSSDKKTVLDETYNEKISKARDWFFDHAAWFI